MQKVGIVARSGRSTGRSSPETLDARSFDAITMQWSQGHRVGSVPGSGTRLHREPRRQLRAVVEPPTSSSNAVGALDDTERMKIWHELHEVFYEEQPYTFMLNSPWIRFISRDVSNAHLSHRARSQRDVLPRGHERPDRRPGRPNPISSRGTRGSHGRMTTYILRRLLLMIPTLLGITFLLFMLVANAPGGIGASLARRARAATPARTAIQQAYLEAAASTIPRSCSTSAGSLASHRSSSASRSSATMSAR